MFNLDIKRHGKWSRDECQKMYSKNTRMYKVKSGRIKEKKIVSK